VLDILLLVELRLLPRGAEEEGKLLVGDHQRKEGRKEGKKQGRRSACFGFCGWVY
jgi:ribosomal protein S9